MPQPLKLVCLVSLIGLLAAQISLIPSSAIAWYWCLLMSSPLLLILPGLIKDRLYTYQCAGFLTLLYFCFGISELVSNPELKLYAYWTTALSTTLFLGVIYYARFLRLQQS